VDEKLKGINIKQEGKKIKSILISDSISHIYSLPPVTSPIFSVILASPPHISSTVTHVHYQHLSSNCFLILFPTKLLYINYLLLIAAVTLNPSNTLFKIVCPFFELGDNIMAF